MFILGRRKIFLLRKDENAINIDQPQPISSANVILLPHFSRQHNRTVGEDFNRCFHDLYLYACIATITDPYYTLTIVGLPTQIEIRERQVSNLRPYAEHRDEQKSVTIQIRCCTLPKHRGRRFPGSHRALHTRLAHPVTGEDDGRFLLERR